MRASGCTVLTFLVMRRYAVSTSSAVAAPRWTPPASDLWGTSGDWTFKATG